MRTIRQSAFILAAVALLFAAVPAAATPEERAAYREKVEPICKVNTKENERIFKGVKKLVKEGKLKPAARAFQKAAVALKKALTEIRAVPQPAGDEARLASWFKYVAKEVTLFEAAARKLKAGQKGPAQKIVQKLTTNANLANSMVTAFEFKYCRLEPARFM